MPTREGRFGRGPGWSGITVVLPGASYCVGLGRMQFAPTPIGPHRRFVYRNDSGVCNSPLPCWPTSTLCLPQRFGRMQFAPTSICIPALCFPQRFGRMPFAPTPIGPHRRFVYRDDSVVFNSPLSQFAYRRYVYRNDSGRIQFVPTSICIPALRLPQRFGHVQFAPTSICVPALCPPHDSGVCNSPYPNWPTSARFLRCCGRRPHQTLTLFFGRNNLEHVNDGIGAVAILLGDIDQVVRRVVCGSADDV
jgi:hypothetical protein